MKLRKKNAGIGLLELMLSLAIIAVLLIMATRYYSSASDAQKIQASVDMINAVRAAVGNYVAGEGVPSSPPSITTLVASGYLPESFGSTSTAVETSNPWGSSIATNPSGSNGFEVLLDTGNADTCQAVLAKINATSSTSSAGNNCGGNGGLVYAKFYY
ncbi:MAG: hypothetical protein CMF49_05375 [Legionellales bacterium]|nr:hypothetical protein [Legionellales bacterium]|tara:strand:- start:27 stop:500 length:474 start_codon:yes stop_codon:yes gene_type:complete